eukprot:6772410-Prymnesium_polylepis.1
MASGGGASWPGLSSFCPPAIPCFSVLLSALLARFPSACVRSVDRGFSLQQPSPHPFRIPAKYP